MIFGWVLNSAPAALPVVRCRADVAAMTQASAGVARLVFLAMKEAAIFGAPIVDVVGHFLSLKHNDHRVSPAHTSCVKDRWVLPIHQAIFDVLGRVIVRYSVNDPFGGVFRRRYVGGCAVGLGSKLNRLYLTVAQGILLLGGAHDHGILSLV